MILTNYTNCIIVIITMITNINPLEAHDRLIHFKKDQSSNLFVGIDECLKKNKDCVSMQEHFPWVYVFIHPRTAEDGSSTRMIYQPRLVKPKAQTNSYLFRAISKTDLVEIIWLLPPRELWSQYEKGKITESEDVMVSVLNFINHREELERPHEDDWTEERIRKKLEEIKNSQYTE